jgi:methyl-accepting chemotaxis protein
MIMGKNHRENSVTSSNESNEEGISSEIRSGHNPHLWVGRILYSAGIIGVIAVILVMIAAPFIANQAGATLETNLLALADGLDDLSTTIVIANDSMDKATKVLLSTAITLTDVNASLDEVVPFLDTVGTIVGETAPETIEATHDALVSAETGAKAIDGVMRALSTVSFITGMKYNPSVPLDDALVRSAASLEPLPDELRQIQDELSGFTSTVENIQPSLGLTATALEDLGESMGTIQTEIEEQADFLGSSASEIRSAGEGISSWIWILVVVIEILLLWAIFGQITILYVGGELKRNNV